MSDDDNFNDDNGEMLDAMEALQVALSECTEAGQLALLIGLLAGLAPVYGLTQEDVVLQLKKAWPLMENALVVPGETIN